MRKKQFRKFYLIFVIILVILAIGSLIYVYKTLKDYEASNPEQFINNLLVNLTSEEVNKYFVSDSKYEDNQINNIRKYFKEKKYEIKKDNNLEYSIYNNNELIFKVKLKEGESIQKLGLLKYTKLSLDELKIESNRGLYYYNITVPDNFKISINGNELNEKDLVKTSNISGLDDLYKYGTMPKINEYEISFLTKEPVIVISNEQNENVNVDKTNINIDVSESFKMIENKEEATKIIGEDIDVFSFIEKWSLFLTSDLSGYYNGFNVIKDFFIEGSTMYQKAYDWAHGIDINFTSKHVLGNPAFTNESVKNYQVYNENTFSCEVTLEKHMIVAGKEKIDKIHSRIYYIKYNGQWKVAQMKAITNEGEGNG